VEIVTQSSSDFIVAFVPSSWMRQRSRGAVKIVWFIWLVMSSTKSVATAILNSIFELSISNRSSTLLHTSKAARESP
jgi:hypothetical protein